MDMIAPEVRYFLAGLLCGLLLLFPLLVGPASWIPRRNSNPSPIAHGRKGRRAPPPPPPYAPTHCNCVLLLQHDAGALMTAEDIRNLARACGEAGNIGKTAKPTESMGPL